MFQTIWTDSDINSTDSLSYNINATGCKIKIQNTSKFALDVYVGSELTDRVEPYSFSVLNNNDYTIKINRTVKSQNVQSNELITYKTVSNEVNTGSTTFTGTLNTNITNSQIDANIVGDVNAVIQNSTLDVNIQNPEINATVTGNVNATITNAEVNANITNATLEVTGNVNANIENQTLQTNIINNSIPVSNVPGGTLQVGGNVNIANTPSVNVSGGQVNIGNTPAVTISGTPTMAISGTPNVNIANASVPISGNVGITSGTVNANIQNASLNAQVVNASLSTNSLITANDVSVSTIAMTNGQTKSIQVPIPAGLYDNIIVFVSWNVSSYTLDGQYAGAFNIDQNSTSLYYKGSKLKNTISYTNQTNNVYTAGSGGFTYCLSISNPNAIDSLTLVLDSTMSVPANTPITVKTVSFDDGLAPLNTPTNPTYTQSVFPSTSEIVLYNNLNIVAGYKESPYITTPPGIKGIQITMKFNDIGGTFTSPLFELVATNTVGAWVHADLGTIGTKNTILNYMLTVDSPDKTLSTVAGQSYQKNIVLPQQFLIRLRLNYNTTGYNWNYWLTYSWIY